MTTQDQRVVTFKLTQFIWLAFGILEGLIGLRILLRLLGANPQNAFAAFLYGITEPFLLPFQTLLGTPQVGQFVLEIPAVIALLVYALTAWVLVRAINIALYTPRSARPPRPPENLIE